jgi:hypothetical protein
MNFLLTHYLYPLQHSLLLSHQLRVTLDNPRTAEEIAAVATFLEASNTAESSSMRLPVCSDAGHITIERLIHDFARKYAPRDPYVKMFCQSYTRDRVYQFLAAMWIVARYDDAYEYALLDLEHQEMQRAEQQALVILGDEHPIVKNSRQLTDYSTLLALLIHTEGRGYFGRGLLLEHSYQHEHDAQQSSDFVSKQFLVFGMACHTPDARMMDEELRWTIFPYIQDVLLQTAQAVDDTLLAHDRRGRILALANMLKAASHDVHDDRMKLIALLSICDSLLGDEAISKLSALLHVYDSTIEIPTATAHLAAIYQLRESLVYGKFAHAREIIATLPKEDEEEDEVMVLQRLISDVYCYLRIIFTTSMRNKNCAASL